MKDPSKLTPIERRLATVLRLMQSPSVHHITSWSDFVELREMIPEFESLTHDQIVGVVNLGLKEWFLRASWTGVGMTPWSGSARRARIYTIRDSRLVQLFLQRVGIIEEYEAKQSTP